MTPHKIGPGTRQPDGDNNEESEVCSSFSPDGVQVVQVVQVVQACDSSPMVAMTNLTSVILLAASASFDPVGTFCFLTLGLL